MLNRLHEKYNASEVAVISIYTDETSEQVSKYVTANDLKFPVYIGSRGQKKSYHTLGTPNFYILDREGKVVESVNGFSDDLEQRLERKIDKLLNKN